MNQNETGFTSEERDRLNAWFPLNDADSQSAMWPMILDQRAENEDSNDADRLQFERDLRTARRLNYCVANLPGRFEEFCRALGYRASEFRSLRELSRLGDPTFEKSARAWAANEIQQATGGKRLVTPLWRGALRHVLASFRPDPPDDVPEEPDEPDDDGEDADDNRELARIRKKYVQLQDAYDIDKNTWREERMTWDAERESLIARQDAAGQKIERLQSALDLAKNTLREERMKSDAERETLIAERRTFSLERMKWNAVRKSLIDQRNGARQEIEQLRSTLETSP